MEAIINAYSNIDFTVVPKISTSTKLPLKYGIAAEITVDTVWTIIIKSKTLFCFFNLLESNLYIIPTSLSSLH